MNTEIAFRSILGVHLLSYSNGPDARRSSHRDPFRVAARPCRFRRLTRPRRLRVLSASLARPVRVVCASCRFADRPVLAALSLPLRRTVDGEASPTLSSPTVTRILSRNSGGGRLILSVTLLLPLSLYLTLSLALSRLSVGLLISRGTRHAQTRTGSGEGTTSTLIG